MRSRMPLEVESVVEALSTECAKITLHVAVTLHVTIKKPLEAKVFAAHTASETIGIVILLNKESKNSIVTASYNPATIYAIAYILHEKYGS